MDSTNLALSFRFRLYVVGVSCLVLGGPPSLELARYKGKPSYLFRASRI